MTRESERDGEQGHDRERVMPSRIMTRYSDMVGRGMMGRNQTYRIYRPQGRREATALELKGIAADQLEQLRRQLEPNLGAGFVAAVDGEIVARGPDDEAPSPDLITAPYDENLRRVHQLTEMAVQQHEYCCAELKRMRQEYEEDFASERAILRTLRQRWLERISDDKPTGEDALRYFADVMRSVAAKSREPNG
jgi:hypothetical protein